MRSSYISIFLLLLALSGDGVQALTSYANEFVNPDFIVAGLFGNNTLQAQTTILEWAADSSKEGPWSVTKKVFVPPSGDIHDFMSWSPYWWPNCTRVGNTTALGPTTIWKKCPYVFRDGQFNPDARLIDDVGSFQALSDAVLYNAIAWALTSNTSSPSSMAASSYIKIWFLDPATRMNPNLNYAQMKRGPAGQIGSHTGVLDLKCLVKVVTAIMILRKKKCADWTTEMDDGMNAWTRQYITWLETMPVALAEGHAPNNHGTFYYNQLAALKILVGDFNGALNVTDTYFKSQYMHQIAADGEQPLEAARTRPYHYHAYNLAAMITNARLAAYVGDGSAWNRTTGNRTDIKTALDFALTLSAAATHEASYTAELYPSIAAVAFVYGDPDGKYAAFLTAGEPDYTAEPYYLWNVAPTVTATKAYSGAAVLNIVNWALAACVMAGLQYAFSF
ncbi:chondroitin AC/alginate lyase [Lyophyllum atratum]|nr:chondroitin AC/alginate lyase [Lyophyllum atratum]